MMQFSVCLEDYNNGTNQQFYQTTFYNNRKYFLHQGYELDIMLSDTNTNRKVNEFLEGKKNYLKSKVKQDR